MPHREPPTTLRQVALEAGVSVATVSRVISGANPVSPETERRVRTAMEALSYSPNRLAQGLRRQETGNLGLVLPGFTNQFFFELISQTVSMAKDAGYSVLVSGDDEPEQEALKLIGGQMIDGLLFVASHGDEGSATKLSGLDVPIVCFDRAPAGLACPILRVDNRGGGQSITEHLLQQGARRVAHVTGPATLEVTGLRLDGYLAGLRANGLDLEPELVIEGDFSEESGANALDRLMELPDVPDAIFAANDLMGIGILRRASERGLRVPEDLLVAGFDGLNVSRFTVPGLTTYAQPVASIAQQSVSRLLDLVQDRSLPTRREVITVAGTLEIRESTTRRKESQ